MTTYTNAAKRDDLGVSWTVTNCTNDVALDCTADVADLGDALGTLIKQLIQKGILKGSVSD